MFLCACGGSKNVITYAYKGVKITRVDVWGETSFYYQKSDRGRSSGRIFATYSGINDGFSGYLRFNDDGKVEILSGDGYFQGENLKNSTKSPYGTIESSTLIYNNIGARERPKLGGNVYYITLSTRYEIERNAGFKSDVKAAYKIDTNKWW
jgi:hypothetical protein